MKPLKGRLIGVPVDLLTTPRNGEVLTDRWWAMYRGHDDGLALFYRGVTSRGWSPQCNGNPEIVTMFRDLYPGVLVEHLPVAFVGRWNENWGHMLAKDLLDNAVEIDLTTRKADQ